MDLSINFKNQKKIKIDTQKIIFFFDFIFSFSKFARDLQNTQAQTQILKKLKTQTQT